MKRKKKNTLIRRAKAVLLRLDRRQRRQPVPPPPVHENHVCRQCGTAYEGRICPQCGMKSTWQRYTWKKAGQGFLDLWGMGNGSMYRTIRDLFWRPGYMIRDYLSGHQSQYFPPFKMLAIMTLFVTILAMAMGVGEDIAGKAFPVDENPFHAVSEQTDIMWKVWATVHNYLIDHLLYHILVYNILLIPAVSAVFGTANKGKRLDEPANISSYRGVLKLNLVETLISQIYIMIQFQILTMVWILIMRTMPKTDILPYYLPLPICIVVLMYDYLQLYGMGFWRTLLRTFLLMATNLLYAVLVIAIFAFAFLPFVL